MYKYLLYIKYDIEYMLEIIGIKCIDDLIFYIFKLLKYNKFYGILN